MVSPWSTSFNSEDTVGLKFGRMGGGRQPEKPVSWR